MNMMITKINTGTPETDAAVMAAGGDWSFPLRECSRRLERQRDEAQEKIERQSDRIRYLEGATNHAKGTPLSLALRERDEAREEVRTLKGILDLLKKEAQ